MGVSECTPAMWSHHPISVSGLCPSAASSGGKASGAGIPSTGEGWGACSCPCPACGSNQQPYFLTLQTGEDPPSPELCKVGASASCLPGFCLVFLVHVFLFLPNAGCPRALPASVLGPAAPTVCADGEACAFWPDPSSRHAEQGPGGMGPPTHHPRGTGARNRLLSRWTILLVQPFWGHRQIT